MWWAELTAGAPSLLCQHCWSFSPSPGLLGLSAAGAEGQSMPRRRETPLEICSVSLGPSQPHSAPPPLLQPHVLPQSCHGEERSPPTALLSYNASPTCPDTTQVHLFEILGDGDGAVLLAELGAGTAVSSNLPRAAVGTNTICGLVGQHFQQFFLPGL